MNKIYALVTEKGLQNDVKIKIQRETVAALAATEVQDKFTLDVTGSLKPEQEEAAKALKEVLEPVIKTIADAKYSVSVALSAGCPYKPIEGVVPIRGGDPMTLEHKEGEVWLVDFWATWCPPCQAPMQHNEDMLAKNGTKWGENVKIVCVSIDQTADAVVKHCDKKDWNRPHHYHRAKSDCSQVYSVNGVPHVMLLDTKGKIVFKGHPANRSNLEEDFETLLKGEEIFGTGCEFESAEAKAAAGGEAAGGDNAEAPAESKLNAADCHAAIDTFAKETAPELQKSLTEHAKKMMRAFCVMVYEETFNCATGKSSIDWKNYRVLVGPQDAIDEVKKQIEENVKGDYEVVLRE